MDHVFTESEDNPSEKVVVVNKELDGIEIDGIENLEDLPRLVFTDEECGNLKVFVEVGALIKNVNKKEKPDGLPAYRRPLSDRCYKREWNKHVEYCESVR